MLKAVLRIKCLLHHCERKKNKGGFRNRLVSVQVIQATITNDTMLYNICECLKVKLGACIVLTTEVKPVTSGAESGENVACFYSARPNVN